MLFLPLVIDWGPWSHHMKALPLVRPGKHESIKLQFCSNCYDCLSFRTCRVEWVNAWMTFICMQCNVSISLCPSGAIEWREWRPHRYRFFGALHATPLSPTTVSTETPFFFLVSCKFGCWCGDQVYTDTLLHTDDVMHSLYTKQFSSYAEGFVHREKDREKIRETRRKIRGTQ